ncbi:MAG: DNA polymerase III subunit alpha [Flavobacteriales bacterium]|nr:DNA polymerase III subunit alpha [Flavobacteriales bacterium]
MHLNCHTYYSYKFGAIAPEELLEQAREWGITSLALTDVNSTSACLNHVRIAHRYGVKPILGIDFRKGAQQKFIAIAKNNKGFEEINRYLSQILHKKERLPIVPKGIGSVLKHAFIIYPFTLDNKIELLDNEFIGIKSKDLIRLQFSKWKNEENKLVALQTATFRNKREYNAHRLLRAVDNNCLLSKLPPEEVSPATDLFLPPEAIKEAFKDFPHLIENANRILEQCSIDIDMGQNGQPAVPKNQKTYSGSAEKDQKLIRKLAYDGLNYRYDNPEKPIVERIEKELEIIIDRGFVSYFLINWDIVNYARRKGYFYVGRGSGANSIIAYLLRITDVDPIDLDLYFERFINLYRQNPPDFDIDFSWRDRQDVTDYIFKRFPNTALLATYSTFQYRAVVRELGKVFGLPKHEIDRLALARGNIGKLDGVSQLVMKYSMLIQGFPSHLSIHAGGILISEKPLECYTPTFMPPKGFPTTQFDMVVAEDLGLYKFDILGQRGLGKIKDGVELVRINNPRDEQLDIHDMRRFKKDEKVKELLREGKAIGCFYVESPAMRMLLRKLKVDNYLGLVAASSIIRPGVAKSGMMREYILRYRNPERRKLAHPVMLSIMPETYGVMVYQEDVIKVAHYYAGLTLGEADVLRRGMSGKYRSREEFQKAKEQFFSNCAEKGYPEEEVAEIWRQTESFAGYAFSKGHSASYAVESYQSLFLKAHYPLEFMVGVINNGGGFYRTQFYVHEARMHGANIEAPCVNKSDYECTIFGKDIYLGLNMLHELESKVAQQLVVERKVYGAFKDFDDFVDRMAISIEQISILIRIDAFRFTGKNKRELLWEAHMKLTKETKKEIFRNELFEVRRTEYQMPNLLVERMEMIFDQIELLGFPLTNPFELLRVDHPNKLLAADMPNYLGKTMEILGYMVTVKDTKTTKGDRMNFGTFIDREGHWIDTVHFPQVTAMYPFRGRGVYVITGKVVEEFGFYSLEVASQVKLDRIEDPRYVDIKKASRIGLVHSDRKKSGIVDS